MIANPTKPTPPPPLVERLAAELEQVLERDDMTVREIAAWIIQETLAWQPDLPVEAWSPTLIIDTFLAHGWTVAGRRPGVYVRLKPPPITSDVLMVMLDKTAPEYAEELGRARRVLAAVLTQHQPDTEGT